MFVCPIHACLLSVSVCVPQDNLRNLFSRPTVLALEISLRAEAWWQMPLPAEPSHQLPLGHFRVILHSRPFTTLC